MSSDFLRWLLDIDVIPKGSDGLTIAWERPWPGWLWAVFIILGGLFAVWSYSRLAGWRPGRGILAGARFGMILLALILLSGPMLKLPRETVEEDWVVLLADRSASMTIADASSVDPAREATSARVTRDAQLQRTLTARRDTFDKLQADKHLVWMGFHIGAFNLAPIETPPANNLEANATAPPAPPTPKAPSLPQLGEADGPRTDLNAALEQALQRAAGRPISGIVLFSDGRTVSPPTRALLRRLQAEDVRVFTVPMGSADPIGDLAIRSVEAPRRAFVRDKVPVVIEVDRLGSSVRDLGGTLKLIDESTGEELDSVALEPGDERDRLTLTADPQLAGEATWQVVIETTQPDLIPENNLKPFNIELIDRPLRVLYVEGYPRWEYHFVKSLIVREESIESSVLLISADREFAQEGDLPITRLPRSSEEFAAYDVIVIGDVPGSYFAPEQLRVIRDQVADRGTGLLWIAGERYTPVTYAGTDLADLLPIRGSLSVPAIGRPVTLRPTPLAERLGVLQLATGEDVGWPAELADPATGWSRLFYAQRIEPGQLKPAVEVLAETASPESPEPSPLVLSMRYGAGQTLYVATDEIWRWRYGRGEMLPNQFWLQMIRMLGRESLTTSGESITLDVNPRRVQTGQPIRVELRLLDARLVQPQQETVRVVMESEKGDGKVELELRRVEGSDDRFAGTYLPDDPGQFRVRLDDATIGATETQASLEVYAPDDELRRPETDHDTLAALATATNGRMLQPSELAELPALLPNREVRTMNPLTEPIWDTPLALALALLLLTGEWIGRKVIRLV